jgi:hypothetical protein
MRADNWIFKTLSDNKNQHFVPRCHFRPFTLAEKGKALNLYNMKQDQCVPNAPVKGQCSRDFFYGEDLKLEKSLQAIEGIYATIIRYLQGGSVPDDGQIWSLRAFAYLQHRRTQAAVDDARIMREGVASQAYSGSEHLRPRLDFSHKAMMVAAMKLYLTTHTYIDDLKCAVGVNTTDMGFVTSDDPVALTNRFFHQRLKNNVYGIANSGALIYMPLTPRHVLICWDPWCYWLPQKRGNSVEISDPSDVAAINALQYQRAGVNVYFSGWETRQNVRDSCRYVRSVSSDKQPIFQKFAYAGREAGTEHFVAGTQDEVDASKHSMIVARAVKSEPISWCSLPKWRDKIRTVNTGSAAQHIRPDHPALSRRR